MDWVSIGIGMIGTMFAFALMNNDREEDLEEEMEDGLKINDGSAGRHVTLSCQTCRKLKRHKEIEPDLYQCTKCKRHVDLRKVS
jgi:acetyl-CoA carboxylase beta subunit